MSSRAASAARARVPLATARTNQQSTTAPIKPGARSISQGPANRSARVEVGRFGVAAKTAAAKVGAAAAPAPSASASSAPAAAIPDIAPGLQSIGAQVKALFDAAATVDGAYRNNYEKVLAADIAKIEKEKVANNLGLMRAKKEAVSYVKGALLDCVTRQGSALALIRAFETTVASKLTESVQVAAKHSELEAAVAERDTRIAELEAETEAAEEGFTEQHGVVVEMESAVQSAADRIKELEEAVAALDAQNQAVEDDRLLAVGHAEELASEVAALKQKEKDREQGSTRLQTEREKLSVEITALQGQSKSLTRDLEKASHERDRFREHLEEARSELSETRERLRSAQKAIDDSIARSTSTATDLMDKNAGYLAQINALVAEKGTISAQADESAREVRALKESEAGLNRQLESSLSNAAALGEELASTRARLESASSLASRLPSVEEGLSVATGRLEEAEKKLAAAAETEAGWRAKELEWIAERAALTASGTAAAEQAAALGAELSSLKSSLGASQDSMAARMATQARETEELRSKARTVGELRRALASSEASLVTVKDDLFSSEMERRRLHNMIQELKGNIRVYVRVRPTLPADADPAAARALAGCEDDGFVADPTTAITVSPDGTNLEILPPPTRGTKDGPGFKRPDKALKYGFDHVFSSRAGQEDVFNEVTHLVQSALDGYQVCLFSYGQTGSGKTHTMLGGHGADAGLIPRSVKKILDTAAGMGKQGWVYSVEVSFLEIYNESVRDLLREAKKGPAGAPEPPQLTVHQDASGATDVPGLTRVPITDSAAVDALLVTASRRRAVASTSMNASSSRSHSVFTLHVRGEHAGKGIAVSGALNLVDLAGSERLDRSGAEGDRKKETAAINKSLSCLADVFTALSKKTSHVPFRNSKLTHLLAPCFKGDGKTLMLVNLSPTLASAFESGCSLRFAAQVSQVELGQPKKRVVETIEEGAGAGAGARSAPAAAAPKAPAARVAPPPTPTGALDTSTASSELDSSHLNASHMGEEGECSGYGYGGEGGEGEDALEDEMDMHTLGLAGGAYSAGVKRPAAAISKPVAAAAPPPPAAAKRAAPPPPGRAGAVSVAAAAAKKPRVGAAPSQQHGIGR